jgi:hypothetical protein
LRNPHRLKVFLKEDLAGSDGRVHGERSRVHV